MPSRPSVLRRPLVALLAATVLAGGLAGCGRRGALEPPPPDASSQPIVPPAPATARPKGKPDTSNRTQLQSSRTLANPAGNTIQPEDEEEVTEGFAASPLPTTRKRVRNFDVPKDPFFLDFLL